MDSQISLYLLIIFPRLCELPSSPAAGAPGLLRRAPGGGERRRARGGGALARGAAGLLRQSGATGEIM